MTDTRKAKSRFSKNKYLKPPLEKEGAFYFIDTDLSLVKFIMRLFIKMTNLSKTKIIAGLFYIFIAFLLLAQEPKKPVLRFISQEPIEKQKRNKVQEFSSDNEKFKGIIIWGAGYIEKFILKDFDGNIIWEKDTLGPGFQYKRWFSNCTYLEALWSSDFHFMTKWKFIKRTDEFWLQKFYLMLAIFLLNRRDVCFRFKGNLFELWNAKIYYTRFKNL